MEITLLPFEQAAEALEGPQRPMALKTLLKNCHRLSTSGALRAVELLSSHCEPEAYNCAEALLGSLAGQMSSLGAEAFKKAFKKAFQKAVQKAFHLAARWFEV